MREKRLAWAGAAVIVWCAACSSGNGNSAGTGGNGDGDSGGVGGGGPGPTVCDHVIADDADLTSGFGIALATDGTEVFVLRDSGTRRIVQRLNAGQLQEVASLDDEPMVYLGGATLVTTANGFFFDVTSAGSRAIYRAPRAGGTPVLLAQLNEDSASQSPPFVADDAYLYAEAPAPSGGSLARIAQNAPGGSAATVVASGVFTSSTVYALAMSGGAFFTVTGSATVNAYLNASPALSPDAGTSSDAAALSEAGALPDAGASPGVSPSSLTSAAFHLALCGSDIDSSVIAGDSALFLGCTASDFGVHAIYQVPLPPAWGADAASGVVTEVVSGNGVNSHTFLARGTSVYYANDADPALYRLPSGGTKIKVMATHGVAHIAATDTDIFVLSACGLQEAPL